MWLTLDRYICQYVEVRQTTPGQAAQWLLIQGVLALIRIAIWIWDPRFDDFTMEKDDPAQRVHLSEAQLVMLWYTQIYPTRLPIEMWRNEASPHYTDVPISYEKSQEQAACPPNWFNWSLPEELQIPTWAVQALDLATRDVSSVFDLARRLRKGGPTWQEDFDKFSSAELFWDMPGWIFMLWVDAHTKQTYLREPDDDKRQWNAYNCRIIQDGAGGFHFLPYWTSCRYYSFGSWDNQEEINDRYYQKVQHIVDVNEDDMPIQGRILQFEVFGDPGLENRIIWSCNSIDQRDAALPRKQELFVGWHEGLQMPPSIKRLHLEIFNHFLDGIKDHTNNMWRDLESIFARVDTQQSYERHPWTP